MDKLVERLLKLDTCAVSDALDRLGLTGAVLGVTPTAPPAKIAGRVVTMKLVDRNAENAATTTHLGTHAIEAGPAPEDSRTLLVSIGDREVRIR